MMDIFPQGSEYCPSTNVVQVNPSPRILSVQFGDGYEQRAPDGINTDQTSYKVGWNNVEPKVFNTIWNFLAPRLRLTSFRWKLPEMENYISVTCQELSRTDHHKDLFSISATFKTDYTPITDENGLPEEWLERIEAAEQKAEQALESAGEAGQAAAGAVSMVRAIKPPTDNGSYIWKNNQWQAPAGADIGLGNVDNTADQDKPLSAPQKNYVDVAVEAAVAAIRKNLREQLSERLDLYVSNSGEDKYSTDWGRTWDTPFATIQAAYEAGVGLYSFQGNDRVLTINIVEGRYPAARLVGGPAADIDQVYLVGLGENGATISQPGRTGIEIVGTGPLGGISLGNIVLDGLAYGVTASYGSLVYVKKLKFNNITYDCLQAQYHSTMRNGGDGSNRPSLTFSGTSNVGLRVNYQSTALLRYMDIIFEPETVFNTDLLYIWRQSHAGLHDWTFTGNYSGRTHSVNYNSYLETNFGLENIPGTVTGYAANFSTAS